MRVEEIGVEPRLAKMETAVQSVGVSVQPVAPIQDTVDLSGDVMRVLKDERRLAAENPTPGQIE